VAKAEEKATTPRFLTLPQAAERVTREELQLGLEEGRLLATDRENWAFCEELDRFREEFALRGVSQADLDAVRAISRRAPIPPQSWWRWFADGSVNWQTGEIVRPFFDRTVIYRPVLRSEDVPAQTAADPTTVVQPVIEAIGRRPAPFPASQSAPKAPIRKWRRDQVVPVVRELFSDKELKTTSTPDLLQRLGGELERRGIRASPDTQLRALGRRR
jgi:hypothetical protein